MLPTWPSVKELIADRGYDSAQFRAELAQRRITACIPSTRFHKRPIPHDVMLYRH
jgi:transposase